MLHTRTTAAVGILATGRTAATAALGIAALATIACESADRRSVNDAIDQREAAMAERAELYETFEAELVAELRDEYGATADDGCPEMEPLPRVGSARLSLLATEAESEEHRQMLEAEAAARGEAFQRNLPGEICRCLQGTLPHVRRALEQSDLQRFADEREAIAAISDEAVTQRVALGGLPPTDVSWADDAREGIAEWQARRHEDWTENPDAWEDGQQPFGWQNFNYRPAARRNLATDSSILTGLRWNYVDRSCDSF